MKRAQVTLFIIIGVVALFMAGLMLYYVGLQVKKPAPKFEDVTPVKNYVTSCVNKLSDEALILAGQQAGVIFASQNGQYPEFQNKHEDKFFNLRKKDRNAPGQAQRGRGEPEQPVAPEEGENAVPSALLKPEGDIPQLYFANPYKYPWIYFPYTPHNQNPVFNPSSITYQGYFGTNVLPKLNKDDGPLSIQYEIESYIGSKLKECTNSFLLFPEYNIEEKEVSASVLFADEDTVINVTYPLEIRKKAGGEATKLSEFTAAKKVRMKKIHEVANWIINNDISDITYDIQQPGIYYGMNIEREPVDANENVGTFITITDPKSILNDRQYEFVFTRQNRNPALWYITEVKNLPQPVISGLFEGPPKGPKGCEYDAETSTVTCEFGWHTRIDPGCCGPDCKSPCCPSRIEYHLPSFTIQDSMFSKRAEDPDEDEVNKQEAYYYDATAPCTTLPCTINPEVHGNPVNTDVTLKVKDPKLPDWQTVHFKFTWKYCEIEGLCCPYMGRCTTYTPKC